MARSSNFDLRKLKSAHGRNKHDLSYRNVFSTQFGMLTPFLVQDVVAGSSVQISLEHQTRTLPLVRPAFTRLREHYDYFFVPYSQLYHAYDNFKTQQTNQRSMLMEAQYPNVVTRLPYFTYVQLRDAVSINLNATRDAAGYVGALGFRRLGDLLSYGCMPLTPDGTVADNWKSANVNLRYNFFRFAAYQKIYFDYYRNDKYEGNYTQFYNLDDIGNDGIIDTNRLCQLGLIHYRWRKKDYFMQVTPDVLPTQNQFAREGFFATVVQGQNVNSVLDGQFGLANNGVMSPSYTPANLASPDTVTQIDSLTRGSNTTFQSQGNGAGQSVASHKFAVARQKLLERMYAAHSDFSSQMLAIYGIAPIEGRAGNVSHIGGFSELLPIGDVENQTSSYTETPYGGKVNRFGSTKNFKYKCKEDGIIMGIYSTSMEADYSSNRIDRFNFKGVPEDYFIPEYENLGKQPLFSCEFQTHYFDSAEDEILQVPTCILGFIPRYDEYRSHPDEVHLSYGAGQQTVGVLQGYTVPANVGLVEGNWYLNQQNMIYKPSNLDGIFGVQANAYPETDQFLCNFYNDVKVISPLKVRSEL